MAAVDVERVVRRYRIRARRVLVTCDRDQERRPRPRAGWRIDRYQEMVSAGQRAGGRWGANLKAAGVSAAADIEGVAIGKGFRMIDDRICALRRAGKGQCERIDARSILCR